MMMILKLLVLFGMCLSFSPEILSAATDYKSVVILAQGRSGSSFLSSWFGSHPKVTYFLEPCSVVYLKEAVRDKTGQACAAVIKQLLSCDFSSVDVKRDQSHFIPEHAVGFKGWGHQRGGEDVRECSQREATVAKELRMGMAWAEAKVDFPKVIIILRDPRAVVNSRVTGWPERTLKLKDWVADPLGWDGKRGFPYDQSLKSLCMEHLKLRERAKTMQNDSVLVVEYTDVLKDSKALLKRVMDFAGIALVPETEAFVEKNLNGTCEFPDEPFSLCRPNIRKVDDKWIKQLPKNHMDEILNTPECEQVIREYYPATVPDAVNAEDKCEA